MYALLEKRVPTSNSLERCATASPLAQAMSFQRILAIRVHKRNAILHVYYGEVTQSLDYTIHNNNLSLLQYQLLLLLGVPFLNSTDRTQARIDEK